MGFKLKSKSLSKMTKVLEDERTRVFRGNNDFYDLVNRGTLMAIISFRRAYILVLSTVERREKKKQAIGEDFSDK